MAIVERVLLDDGVLSVADVRCLDAPARASGEELAPSATLVIPLAGVFVRHVRTAGSSTFTETIGDPTRALVFRTDEPYRVAHPVSDTDRCLIVSWRDPELVDLLPDRYSPPGVQLAARRLVLALTAGALDPLAGAEMTLAIVDALGPAPMGRQMSEGSRRRKIASVRLSIADRLGERRTLADLGRLVGLTGWELARQFRRATGTSMHQYRTRLRVAAALERIEAGERDLTGLALDLGFADHSHMTNTIRRTSGRPPSAYRNPPTLIELAGMRTNLQA